MQQDICKMMPSGVQTIQLRVDHVRYCGQWIPIRCRHMRESPDQSARGQPTVDMWVLVDINWIIKIDEREANRLPKHKPGGGCQEHAADKCDGAWRRDTGAAQGFHHLRLISQHSITST